MARATQAATIKGWQEIATPLAANSGDLPHLEAHRLQLAELLKQAQDLDAQQAALTASKQEISKQLVAVLGQGEKLATFLRTGVRQHYGNRAEKLVEFGLQPFRSRPRRTKKAPPTEVAPPPKTEGETASPSSTAPDSSSTD